MENIFYTCRDPNQKCYPRYHNMNKRLKDLQQRYADLQATLYGGAVVAESFRDVRFIILSQKSKKSNKTVDNSIEEALFPVGDIGTKLTVGRSLQEVLTKIKTEVTVIVFIPSGIAEYLHGNISKNRDVTFVIVVSDTKAHKETTDLYKEFINLKVSLFEDIKDTASVALEENIFSPMRYKTEILVRLLKSNGRQHTHADKNKKRKTQKTYIGTKMCRICLSRKCVRFSRKPGKETNMRMTTRMKTNNTQIKIDDTEQGVKKHRHERKRRREMLVCRECVRGEFQRSGTIATKEHFTRSKVQAEINRDKSRKRKVQKTYIGTKMCGICLSRKCVRFSRKPGKESNKRKPKRKKTNNTHIKIDDTAQGVRKHRHQRATKEHFTRSKVQAEMNRVFEENVHKHKDSIERLLGEILGLYNRSRVPEKDRPVINESLEQNVSDEIAAELYAIDASVKSCGYRFSTLQVFVDDISNAEINDKIREVLRKNNITSCDIVPSIGSFKPLYKVGAKVHPNQLSDGYGTVGGFATKNKQDLCALVSRHVAIRSTDGNVCLSNGDRKIQASIIPETSPEQGPNDTLLDISAAEIRQMDNKKCDTRFKTECGDLTTGKESRYDPKILRNMQVHHWGATTSPGLGIITMPEIRDRDKDNSFIIVEDRQNSTDTLCKGGDSGSIVCADYIDGEGVEVVSMIIGEDIHHVGKYATLRIDKGLEQIKQQTNDDFHLCKD